VPYVLKHPKTGHLNYRRRIPADLKPFVPGSPSEFVRTLGSHNISSPGAVERFRAAHTEYQAMIAKARIAQTTGATPSHDALTPELIRFLADHYLASELARDEETRWGRDPVKVAYVPREDLERDWELSREMLSSYQGAALKDHWAEWSLKFAKAMGFTLNQSDPEFGKYLEAIADAACRLWLAVDRRIDAQMGDGEPVDTPPMPGRPDAVGNSIRTTNDNEKTFEDIANAILNNPRQDIGASTKQSSQTALRFFREACGLPTPAKITRAIVSEWLDLMARLPSKPTKAQRGLPLPEVVKLYDGCDDVTRLAAKTYNGHASALAALWNKAQKAGQIAEGRTNPFANQRVANAATPAASPKGFSKDELEAIFTLPIFTHAERPKRGKGEASYWIPLLLLWTGARPEEVAQLMVSDFHAVGDGNWIVSFTDEGVHPTKGQRNLKTSRKQSGRRTIPVPKELIDLGLPEYLDHLRAANETALFPLLRTRGARGLTFATWGEWWSKLLRENHILAERNYQRQPAREFRHTWTTAARAVGIPREAREYIQGHKAKDGTANEDYGDLSPLGAEISRLTSFGCDFSGVKRWTSPQAWGDPQPKPASFTGLKPR
jgi:integrase